MRTLPSQPLFNVAATTTWKQKKLEEKRQQQQQDENPPSNKEKEEKSSTNSSSRPLLGRVSMLSIKFDEKRRSNTTQNRNDKQEDSTVSTASCSSKTADLGSSISSIFQNNDDNYSSHSNLAEDEVAEEKFDFAKLRAKAVAAEQLEIMKCTEKPKSEKKEECFNFANLRSKAAASGSFGGSGNTATTRSPGSHLTRTTPTGGQQKPKSVGPVASPPFTPPFSATPTGGRQKAKSVDLASPPFTPPYSTIPTGWKPKIKRESGVASPTTRGRPKLAVETSSNPKNVNKAPPIKKPAKKVDNSSSLSSSSRQKDKRGTSCPPKERRKDIEQEDENEDFSFSKLRAIASSSNPEPRGRQVSSINPKPRGQHKVKRGTSCPPKNRRKDNEQKEEKEDFSFSKLRAIASSSNLKPKPRGRIAKGRTQKRGSTTAHGSGRSSRRTLLQRQDSKVLNLTRMFSSKKYDRLSRGELQADIKSYKRSKAAKEVDGDGHKRWRELLDKKELNDSRHNKTAIKGTTHNPIISNKKIGRNESKLVADSGSKRTAMLLHNRKQNVASKELTKSRSLSSKGLTKSRSLNDVRNIMKIDKESSLQDDHEEDFSLSKLRSRVSDRPFKTDFKPSSMSTYKQSYVGVTTSPSKQGRIGKQEAEIATDDTLACRKDENKSLPSKSSSPPPIECPPCACKGEEENEVLSNDDMISSDSSDSSGFSKEEVLQEEEKGIGIRNNDMTKEEMPVDIQAPLVSPSSSTRIIDDKSFIVPVLTLKEEAANLPLPILVGEGSDFTIKSGQKQLYFKDDDDLEEIFEVETLIVLETSWGDVWDDLYYTADEMAQFKYDAFLEECAEENGMDWLWD